MANIEKTGDRTTFLCGKTQHFLSKIPDAKGVTAHSVQMGCRDNSAAFLLEQDRTPCVRRLLIQLWGKGEEGKTNFILANNFCNFTEATLLPSQL